MSRDLAASWLICAIIPFQLRVDNNHVAFAKGDVLVCDLRTIQWQVEDGVKSEYEVVRVVSHRPARQLSFLDDDV